MSEGNDHMEEFSGDINLFLVGANNWCKCQVGNAILGYKHFLPENLTSDEEVSLQIGARWITVIQEHLQETATQRFIEISSRCPCMILFAQQHDHVSQRDVETFAYFQQKLGKKMEEKTVVVLVRSEDESVRPKQDTDKNLEKSLHQYGYRICNLNKDMEQSHFIKLITSVPKKQAREHERTIAVEKEIRKPKEEKTPEHLSGGNQAAVKKKNTLTIVLLGQTGSGKSASGNTILRKPHFESHASSVPVTQVCKMAEETVCGIKIRVIDTPDFFDEGIKNQKAQIKKCRELAEPGPDVYLLVMEMGRFTDGEREIIQNIQSVFDAEVAKETIVLFTNKEKLRGKTLSEYIKNTDTELQELIRICGARYHAFNNNDHNVSQVEKLVEMILEMKRKTGIDDILEHYSYYRESEKKDCTIQ